MTDLTHLDEDFFASYQRVREKCLESGLSIRPVLGFITIFDHAERWRAINSDVAIMMAVQELETMGCPFLSEVLSSSATGRILQNWNPRTLPGFDRHNWGQAMDVAVTEVDPFSTQDAVTRNAIFADIVQEEGLILAPCGAYDSEIVHIQAKANFSFDSQTAPAVDQEMYKRYRNDNTNH